MRSNKKKFLIILISPSGGGKTALYRRVLNDNENIKYSVSFTTRKPRVNEIDGVDYNFVSQKKFLEMKNKGEFLESAMVHGYWYGTSKEYVSQILEKNNIIMDIDVQGAKQIIQTAVDQITIFILPPSREIWLKRLKKRGSESEESLSVRLDSAKKEIMQARDFDYLVINDKLETAIKEIEDIISAEENKTKRYINIKQYIGG
ncbi:MAG: guanylate kinase [Candidatus Cloacimonetes bacterium]|nr:guanylate kinase [Candidatus Cloacimonadota bacterium]